MSNLCHRNLLYICENENDSSDDLRVQQLNWRHPDVDHSGTTVSHRTHGIGQCILQSVRVLYRPGKRAACCLGYFGEVGGRRQADAVTEGAGGTARMDALEVL